MGVFEPEHDMCISIHALLAESDFGAGHGNIKLIPISIHALLAESDFHLFQLKEQPNGFLSTLSLRRATYLHLRRRCRLPISIHALLAESDDCANFH